MAEGHVEAAREPILKLKFLSHGTLEAINLDQKRKFYKEFLGLEVVRTSQVSLMIRLGNTNTIAVVKNERKQAMPILNHNGLDVSTREEVDKCHEIVMAQKDKWSIKKVTRPVDQHGTRSFYLLDLDDNWWEICATPRAATAGCSPKVATSKIGARRTAAVIPTNSPANARSILQRGKRPLPRK